MVLSGTDIVDFLFSLAESKGLERSLDSANIVETMRGFLEDSELARIFFTDSGAGITINMWPWIISSVLLLVSFPLLAGIISNLHVPMQAFYSAAVSNYGHGRNDYDDEYYDDYDISYDRYDSRDRVRDRDRNRDRERNRDRDFRKRKNQRPLRAQYKQEEDEDYSYSDSWKDDDYFRDFKDSWDRQAKELPDTLAEPDMLSSWSDNVAQRVKMIN